MALLGFGARALKLSSELSLDASGGAGIQNTSRPKPNPEGFNCKQPGSGRLWTILVTWVSRSCFWYWESPGKRHLMKD